MLRKGSIDYVSVFSENWIGYYQQCDYLQSTYASFEDYRTAYTLPVPILPITNTISVQKTQSGKGSSIQWRNPGCVHLSPEGASDC